MMPRELALRGGLVVALLTLGGFVAWTQMRPPRVSNVRATLSVDRTLGGADTSGFLRALVPRPLVFPADHGPHPAFRNEWWYLTGNLEADDGRRFGYQLTIFRAALAPPGQPRDSRWATNQVWMAHFALTDASRNRFLAFERFARGALGLAGATAAPFRVWLENWSMATEPQETTTLTGRERQAGAAARALDPTQITLFPLRVRATEGDVSIDLLLHAGKPLVLNGDSGLSRKGADPGNASIYYAFTRLLTTGSVIVNQDTLSVSGSSWLDREWSTSALETGTVGWDWFAIQLSDSTELMVSALRRQDGSPDPFSTGTFVAPDGQATPLGARDFSIESSASWMSPADGTEYPAHWTIHVPSLDLVLDVQPVIAGQELNLSFRYWEGAVNVVGARAGSAVSGHGYVELTGYADTTSPLRR